MINIKLENQKEIEKIMEKAAKKYPDETKKGVKLACIKVEKEAKQLVPVDTGKLKSSITYKVKNFTGTVGTKTEYAPYVEFGTRPHFAPVGKRWAGKHGFGTSEVIFVSGKAHPFLQPALYNSKSQIYRIFRDVLKGIKL